MTLLLAGAVAILALGGCGGSGNGAKAASRQDDCKTALRAKGEAMALAKLYATGRLGSAQKVRAESSKAHPFVLPNGKMVPYDRMTSWQRAAFNDWAASPQVDRVAHSELEDADRAAAVLAKAQCG